jgi:3-hydroxyisobutyrate dehydrogenase
MAKNLLQAGYPLTVFDLNSEPVKELVPLGAVEATSCADASRGADTIITILPADQEVQAAVLGEKGVLEGARAGSTLIDMTSLAPHTSRAVAAEAASKGLKFMDAPVSGGNVAAEKGALTIMVGGEKEVLEEQRDVLETLGSTIFHVGGVGMAETVKMANQILVGINIFGIIEAFLLAVKLGADPKTLYEVLKVSAGGSWMLENRMPNYILKGDFSQPGFALDLLRKDVGLAVESGKGEKVPMLLSSQVFQALTWASAAGQGTKDFSSLVEVLEELVGVKVRAS